MEREKYEELLNNANLSRFSDFGYTNDKEALEHYTKVREFIKNRPLKPPMESFKNKFDLVSSNNTRMPSLTGNSSLGNQKQELFNREKQNYHRVIINERKFVEETEF